MYVPNNQHRQNILILKMRNRSSTICLESQHHKIHTACIMGSDLGSKLPACAPQSCDRFVKYRGAMGNPWGSEETAQITHGKVKRGEIPLMMLILPEERRSITEGRGRGDFALSHLKGLKGKGRKRETVGVLSIPNSRDAFKRTEIGTAHG